MAARGLDAQRRVYRAMLTLHPKRFRREYGDLMVQLFADQLRDARSSSRVWTSTVRDLAVSVSSERLEDSMRSSFVVALGGAMLAMVGSVGVVRGHNVGAPSTLAFSVGLMVIAIVGAAVLLRRLANQPSALAVSPAGMAVTRSPIQLLRWLAVPVATLGLILAFFGLTWRSAVEAGAGIAVLTVSALIWRGFGGR